MRCHSLIPFLSCAASVLAAQTVPADTALARRVQLGATLAAVSDSMRARGLPSGAFVLSIINDSPASIAGLRPGDVLVRIGSDTVRGVADALGALRPLVPGRSVPLTLVRNGRVTVLTMLARERARETSREFTIEYRAVPARGGKHRVLVSHPSDGRPHPAVLLIGGIGCYSIDSPIGVLAYRDLAYHLARRGYTTVRVEKLGIGDSEGASCLENDFETELDGYRQALIAMKSYSSIDSSRIIVFGHSIGGIEAPLLAREGGEMPHIRGVAVLSTTGIAWYEYELANLRRQLRLQVLAPDSVERAMRLKTTCMYRLLLEKQPRPAILAGEPHCAPYIAYPASDAYMQTVVDLAPAIIWRGVNAPALVMHSASDFVTNRDEHLELTDDINMMHPGAAVYADIPELDHYLSHQASEQASFRDPIVGLNRPYYGATLEPVLDRWLEGLKNG